jgi:hypothetical protein
MSAEKPTPLAKYDGKLSLSHIFNKEVQRALQDYSHLRGKFAFVNNADKTMVYDIDPAVSGFRSKRQLERYLLDAAAQSSKAGPFSSKDPNLNLSIIAYSPLPISLFTRGADSAEKEALAIFDHELGHLVVKGSMASRDPTYRECAADAFSIIRHMQRYGTQTDIISIISWRRAFDFVTSGNPEHFTTLAVDELDRLKSRIDFQEMTAEQIKDLAMRIALNHTPHPDISNNAAMAFAPVRQTLQQTRGNLEMALRTLAEITLDYKDDYHIFKIGSTILQSFLDGKIANDKGPMQLKGQFWDDVRHELKEQSDNLAKNHVLMGMPVIGQTPPAAKPVEPSDKPFWRSGPPSNSNPPPPSATARWHLRR